MLGASRRDGPVGPYAPRSGALPLSPSRRSRERLLRAGAILACAAIVAWVRLLPLSLDGLAGRAADAQQLERLKAERRYTAADGREYVYLDDLDSYLWLRQARNVLEHGSTCGARDGGECRDPLAHAPFGRADRYAGSLHPFAIAAVHRVATVFDSGFPLPASSFLVPLLASLAGILPAFFIGLRLGGLLGGIGAALLIGCDPFFLARSGGSDNDVWNVVLPLFAAWGAVAALDAKAVARRVAAAVAAGVAVGLHAATWRGWVFTYVLIAAGLALTVAFEAARGLVRRDGGYAAAKAAALVLVVFYFAAGLAVTAIGNDATYWTLPLRLAGANPLASGAREAAIANGEVPWPELLSTVGELGRSDLDRIIELTATPLLFLACFVGAVAISLPRRGWRWWHLLLLVAFAVAARSTLAANGGRVATVAPAAIAIAIASILSLATRSRESLAERGAAIIAGVWFLAALFLSFSGARFVLLLVVPLGLVGGGALGRIPELLADLAEARLPQVAGRWLRPALLAAMALLLAVPVQLGATAARQHVPEMRDAWWDALSQLAQSSPPDAIVHVWWDRGYWAEYASGRRVSSDGASLLTHVPYWFARALLAGDERETAGLLRMLDCGSDLVPEPEGSRGALTRLIAAGVDPVLAPALIAELAGLDRAAAAQRLEALGLDTKVRDEILAATHCDAPPTYLVLSNRMLETLSWRKVGSWSFERAFAARAAARMPRAELEQTLRRRLGLDEEAAATLADEVSGKVDVQEIATDPSFYLTPDWLPCKDTPEGDWSCGIPANPRRLSRFVYRPDAPEESELVSRLPSGRETSGGPGVIVVAGASERQVFEPEEPANPRLGVLVDLVGRRLLIGSAELVRSSFTDLVFLDGRTSRLFEKVDERRAVDGETVTTWRVSF